MIGDAVRVARERRGLTIAEVARRAEVDPVHLSRFETGHREMSSGRLGRVLDALGLELSEPEHGTSDQVVP